MLDKYFKGVALVLQTVFVSLVLILPLLENKGDQRCKERNQKKPKILPIFLLYM